MKKKIRFIFFNLLIFTLELHSFYVLDINLLVDLPIFYKYFLFCGLLLFSVVHVLLYVEVLKSFCPFLALPLLITNKSHTMPLLRTISVFFR